MRPPRPSHGVPAVLASLLVVAAAAPAAHAERAAPAGDIAGSVASVSPDGSLVTTQTGEGRTTLSAARLAGSGSFSGAQGFGRSGGAFPITATAADGSAALLVPSFDNTRLVVATRPAGGRFGKLAPLGTDLNDASSVATGGGVLLAGSAVTVDLPGNAFSTQPVVLRRAADGTLAPPIVLPGGPNESDADGDVQVGVDAAGRGVVAWTRGRGSTSRVNVAAIAADGTVGAATELPGRSPDSNNETGVQVRVAADGTGAVAWPTGDTVSVAPVSTTGPPDLTKTASVKLGGSTIQLQPDGAALVSVVHAKGGRRLYVASRAAGKPFTAVKQVKDVRGGFAFSALSGGTWVATQRGGGTGYPSAPKASFVYGRAGGSPSRAIPVPIGATSNVDVYAATPGGSPLVLSSATRTVVAQRDSDAARSQRTQAFRPVSGKKIAARTSVRMASRQRLGRSEALRMTIRCSVGCSYRVVSSVLSDTRGSGQFDTSRTMRRGTRSVSIPYGGSSEGDDTPNRRLRKAQRVRFAIAVDDARGGETVVHRTVNVRP